MARKFTYLLFMGLAVFSGCEKVPRPNMDLEVGKIEGHTVSFEQAKKIALLSSVLPPDESLTEKQVESTVEKKNPKKIAESLSVTYTQNKASFFIFNFEGGGFTIVAGDDRLHPILAYSETNSFPLDSTKYYPPGLVEWLTNLDDRVREIRLQNKTQSKEVEARWHYMDFKSKIASETAMFPEFPECFSDGEQFHYTSYSGGPLLSTTWSQGVGYNDNLPYMACPSYSNGKPPAGCVATATAQIMKFHEFPASFNWASMPDHNGSAATAALMADIGSNVNMDYDCDGSGAETSEAADALVHIYGYSSAIWNDSYSAGTVFTELRNGRPVILSGGRKDKWWFFNVYADGHAWVVDGGVSSSSFICDYYYDDGDPHSQDYEWNTLGHLTRLYVNWGWGGLYNGSYDADNFNPGSNTFNYRRGMITHIIP